VFIFFNIYNLLNGLTT